VSEVGWLALSIVAGAVFAGGWVLRERWVRSRRGRR
jgi:hypothetical protein